MYVLSLADVNNIPTAGCWSIRAFVVTSVPPSWLFFRHGGVLRYINSYGNIRIASYWQRTKDKWRGLFAAWKQGKFFDSILDHNMSAYHEYISNMDDKGEQLPK